MKTQKNKLVLLALLLTLSLMMTACQGEQATAPAAEEAPANTPVAAADADKEPAEEPMAEAISLGVDPANDALGFDAAYLFETLTDSSGAPFLASTGEVSDDELDYILELNTAVNFQDGSVMDADAVIANFNRWFDPENEYRSDGEYAAWVELFEGFKGELDDEGQLLSSFDGIEKVNDFTVLLHLNRPVPELMVGLSDPAFSILSPTALAKDDYVGTGAYIVTEATDDSLTLAPFADYWQGAMDAGMTVDIE